jgi:hypothetical protein
MNQPPFSVARNAHQLRTLDGNYDTMRSNVQLAATLPRHCV